AERKEKARGRDGSRRDTDGAPQSVAELTMSPAVRPAIVGLEDEPGWRVGLGQREKEPGEIVDMDQRQAPGGRHVDLAAARHLEQVESLRIARPIDRRWTDNDPIEARFLDEPLGLGLRRPIERELRLACCKRRDVNESPRSA